MKNLQKYDKNWLGLVAAIYGFSAIALGAFGAHMLKATVTAERLATWQTGIEYQMFHTIALLVIVLLQANNHSKILDRAAYFLTSGVLIFSGSLYVLVLTDTAWLGMITPIGGVLMLVGWALLIWHFIRQEAT